MPERDKSLNLNCTSSWLRQKNKITIGIQKEVSTLSKCHLKLNLAWTNLSFFILFRWQQTGLWSSSTPNPILSHWVRQPYLSSQLLLMQHADLCSCPYPEMCSMPGLQQAVKEKKSSKTKNLPNVENLKQHQPAKVGVSRSPVQYHWAPHLLYSGSIAELHLYWQNCEVRRGRQVCRWNDWNIVLGAILTAVLSLPDSPIPANKLPQS